MRLATSEIVTNAMVHAGGVGSITVRLTSVVARVEVADSQPELPVFADPDAGAGSGRGLHMVDAVTDRWGVDTDSQGGKAVWFIVRADGPRGTNQPIES